MTQPPTSAPLTSGGGTGEVMILRVRFYPDGEDTGRESVTLQGVPDVDLTGWWLVDE
jgi:hypothetical protein